MSKKNKVVKYKNPINFNIGFIIFFVIILYVLFSVFSYFFHDHIAEYEVQKGSIASNYTYKAVIIRDETVEYAQEEGYVNYYVPNNSKVSLNDIVYSIDTVGNISKKMLKSAKEVNTLSADSIQYFSKEIDDFVNQYSGIEFQKSYSFYNELKNQISHETNQMLLSNMTDEVAEAEANHSFFKYKSKFDGVVSFQIDGYEGKTVEDIFESEFKFDDYQPSMLESNVKVTKSTPVYKTVNSENWNLILQISESLAKELNDRKVIKIRFCKDDFRTKADCSILKKSGNYYLNLSLNKAMIRYLDERFVDVELLLNDDIGLKIPKSAITKKEFFTIPKSCFTRGGESDDLGLMIKTKDESSDLPTFITPTIYYEAEEYYFVDHEELSPGMEIIVPESLNSYVVGNDKDTLTGVYNINKGYAVFKQIKILYENEEYAIIATKTPYGVSLYDHIALDATKIKEHELTTK